MGKDSSGEDCVSRRVALRAAAAALAAGLLPCCARSGTSKHRDVAGEANVSHPTEAGGASVEGNDWDISVCGLNCARCKILTENKECKGCRGPLDEHWSPGCEFLPCARERGHEYCFECDDFPCEKLEAFASDGYEHHHLAVENLRRMREIGLDAWIAEQPEAMFCPGWHF